MSSSLDIYPFHDTEGLVRFCVQICVFLIGVIVAQKLIIKPSLRLYNERIRRTVGNTELAHKVSEQANQLENEYFVHLKEGAEAAKNLRIQKIQQAQDAANQMIAENQKKAELYLQGVETNLSTEIKTAKNQLSGQIENIVTEIYRKIGFTAFLVTSSLAFFYVHPVFAQEEKLVDSYWYSVFWPYFQFVCFLVAAVYFGRKPIAAMLEKRRDDLRLHLSEAKEAITLAERKMMEYKEKIALLEKELKELKEQSLFDAKIESEKIIAEAAKASESIMRDAERAARELITRNREEMQGELFKLALAEVEKRLTPEKMADLDLKYKNETLSAIRALN